MNRIDFTFSDLISGYVEEYNQTTSILKVSTSNGRPFLIKLTPNTYAKCTHNLDEPWADRSDQLVDLLISGQLVFIYGTFFPEDENHFEANYIVFAGDAVDHLRCNEPDWWRRQIDSIASAYLKWQFNYPHDKIDYENYRTVISLTGGKAREDYTQETDTISRMVYGMASAYMLTGKDEYLVAAETGTLYLREHMRFVDNDTGLIYWYHGMRIGRDGRQQKLLVSEFSDDYDCIPAYEQIYALAGPVQTYRITGDPLILEDVDKTIALFNQHYRDQDKGGYYSHINAISLSPHDEDLGRNCARKNWNSVGDHAPAYLINLWLATAEPTHMQMLEDTFDWIVKYFPDNQESPFVQEKFFDDWSKDQQWGWQQNRAVVGHNLKIVWNLMRFFSVQSKSEYAELACKIANDMPNVGYDSQRFGWYDVVERVLDKGQRFHRFAWHDRKAWWQQEQGILAYLILMGHYPEDQVYKKYAWESSAFYNAFFLDHNDGGIYFNTLANGIPFLVGTERFKGSHSMSAYHSTELCFLATVYHELLIAKRPIELFFNPLSNGFKNRLLRVSPDMLPYGQAIIKECTIDGSLYHDYNPSDLVVQLPNSEHRLVVRVVLMPAGS